MRIIRVIGTLLCASLLATPVLAQQKKASSMAEEWTIPVVAKTMKNGLTVIVSEDHSAHTFGMNIIYRIGYRLEPSERSGFAHLFEHMMFEGTPDAKKGVMSEVVRGGGGWYNADTRADYTEYIDSAPISALDPVLWCEADRMKTLDFNPVTLDNQRKVVEEELRGSVLNRPYQLFYVIDLPDKAFDNFANTHNPFGNFQTLDAATVDDVKSFYEHFYAPNNAIMVIVGDVTPDEVFAKVEKYFGRIAPRKVPPPPDVSESPQKTERRFVEDEKMATTPALAIGYRMPPGSSPDALVGGLTAELLASGSASRLNQVMVQEKKVATDVSGGANWPLGTPFAYGGPTLMTVLVHYPSSTNADTVISTFDGVVADLDQHGPSQPELERVRTKMLSDWYSELESPVERATAIAYAQLFYGNTDRVNEVGKILAKITANDVRAFVAKYMRPNNRTIIIRQPVSAKAAATKEGK
ncbi:MAG: pitrilysin family protein [Terriglobia bacterium]|nr:pitrilysin family protein [Terriglobia bacterium]